MALTHSTVATGANDPAKQVSVTAWNQAHAIDQDGITIPAHLTQPTNPAAGNVTLFTRNYSGRMIPAWIGPSGLDTTAQPNIARNRVRLALPSAAGATATTLTGFSLTTNVGTPTARAFATTNALTRLSRVGLVSAATAGSLSHQRSGNLTTGAAIVATGDGATYPLGGFFMSFRGGISDAATVAGARMFIGFRADTAAPTNVEPNTFVNSVGLAQLSTDATQLYLVYGGTTAQTAIALGATNFPVATNYPFELTLFAPPGAVRTIYYEVANLSTGAKVSGTLTGTAVQVPDSTVALAWHVWRCNNATALAVAYDFGSLYIETDQ